MTSPTPHDLGFDDGFYESNPQKESLVTLTASHYMVYSHINPDYDADAVYQADRKRKAVVDVDRAVYAFGKFINLGPMQCEECMSKVREVLRSYEHS